MRFLVRAGSATVRVAALALRDLQRRHRERFGHDGPVDQAIHAAAADAGVVRQLTRALGDADLPEKAAICFVLGALRDPSTAPVLTGLLDAARGGRRRGGRAAPLGPEAEPEILRGIRDGATASRARCCRWSRARPERARSRSA